MRLLRKSVLSRTALYATCAHLIWSAFFVGHSVASRIAIAVNHTPSPHNPVTCGLYVAAIDLPVAAALSILAVIRFPQRWATVVLQIIFGLLATLFFLINASSVFISRELGRLPSLNDLFYAKTACFIQGSLSPVLLSPGTLCLFIAPLILLGTGMYIGARKGFRLPTRGLLIACAAWALAVVPARRVGYGNPVQRFFPASCSCYFHSLFHAMPTVEPATAGELTEFLELRRALFDADLPCEATPHPDSAAPRPNIILLIMESFSDYYIDTVFNGSILAPTMRRMASMGRRFTQCYSNSYMSARALWAIHTGELDIEPAPTMLMRPDTRLDFVTELLRKKGYYNAYFHGNTALFENRGYVLSHNGFDLVWDTDSFPQPVEILNWGMSDRDLVLKSFSKIDQLVSEGRPLFATVLTISNHHPYHMPEAFRVFTSIEGIRDPAYLNGLLYSDNAAGIFLDSLLSRSWFRDSTYLFVTADNGIKPAWEIVDAATDIDLFFHIPCILIGPSIEANETDDRVAGQVDIAATVCDLAGIGTRRGVGNSLLRPPFRRWQPIIGTFFGTIIVGERTTIVRDHSGTYTHFGAHSSSSGEEQIQLIQHYESLWTSMVMASQLREFCALYRAGSLR